MREGNNNVGFFYGKRGQMFAQTSGEDIENKRPTLCVGKQPAKRALSLLFTTVKYLDTCQQCKMKLVDYYMILYDRLSSGFSDRK